MIGAIRRRLPVEAGEGRTVSLLLVHSFAMGASTVFFETAASALFLARFGSTALPYVYVAAAVMTVALGAGYTRIQGRLAFGRLMMGTLWFLVATVLALRLGLAATGAAWLVFFLLVWYRAISILTDLEFWAVAGRLYDVRQAKRLFGVVGSGEVVARIAGSFAVPLLLRITAVANLLVLSAVALLACALVASMVLRDAPEALSAARSGAASTPPPPRDRLSRLARDPYIRTILGLAFFAVLAKYLVDFAFLEQMRARYADVGGLATFFAIFSGTSQAVSLLTRLLVSGPLLSRYGIRVGLLVLPLVQVVCTAAIVIAGFVPGSIAAVFWLVVANQGIYKTLKHPIDNPSFKVLYQPLPRERRLAVQVAVETLLTPMTIGLAGGLMVLFSRAIHYDPVVFAWVMLATFACWAWVARTAGAEYVEALVHALRRRVMDDEPFAFGDPRSLEVLERTLLTGETRDVLFALDLMEKASYAGLDRALLRLLDHASPEVRRSVLLRLARRAPAAAREPVAARLAREGDPRVRAAALRCLCAVGGRDVWPQVLPALHDPDPEVRRGAMIGLLRAEAEPAYRHLVFLASESRASDRAWAARIIGEVGRRGFHAPLRWLLTDGEPEVRRAALAAAGRVRADELWPGVAENLGLPPYRATAAQALVAGGEAVLPTVASVLQTATDPAVARQAAWVCGRIAGPRAVELLRPLLDVADPTVRLEVLRGLFACGYQANGDGQAAPLRRRLVEEVRDATWSATVLRDVGDAPELAVLRLALELELARNREATLLILSFLHDRTAIQRAREGLGHPSRERRAYALEVLDVTLDGELKTLVLPLLEDLDADAQCRRLAGAVEPRGGLARVTEVLQASPRQVTPLTRAAAAHAAVRLDARALLDVVRQARADPSPLVQETARWAVGCLGGTISIAGGNRMLTIEKVILLKSVPMFAEASEETLADVAGILEEVEVPAGQVVFEKGTAGDSMYVVASGRVGVYDGDRTITELGDREIFGELALLDPEPRFASIRAVEDTVLLRLDREAFAELMAGNIEIVRGVLHVLCERLRHQASAGAQPWRDAPSGQA